MNERIRELALQAEKTVKSHYPNDDMNIGVARMMTVFAELIVEKCAGIIESQDVDPSFKLRMSWAVKQYFGVEE